MNEVSHQKFDIIRRVLISIVRQWFHWLSFDIIGALAFGQSFDAVREGTCLEYLGGMSLSAD